MVEINPTSLPELFKPSRDLLELRKSKFWGGKIFRKNSKKLTTINLFPNRGFLLRVLSSIKEGSTQKHTQSVKRPARTPGPESQGHFENHSGFTIKVKIYLLFYTEAKIVHGFCRVGDFQAYFPYCLDLLAENFFC